VLTEQKSNTAQNLAVLRQMRDDAYELRALCSGQHIDLELLGKALHRGWMLKRGLATRITNSEIDQHYARAIEAGAEGGKLCGAGGGGFLMFIVKPEKRDRVRHALAPLGLVTLGYEVHGSRVLYPSD
jgi:D-glycero-alpha-D-manno-heptose-7-phosphate kinase